MNVAGEFIAQDPGQPLLRGFLRANLWLFFRGLIQPPTPIAVQRGVLSALSASCQPFAKRVPRKREHLAGIDCEWHKPSGASEDNILLYLHGGGFLLGSPRSHRPLCGTLAHLANMPLCVPEYRLSPEARLPAALVCLSPLVDPRCNQMHKPPAGDPMLNPRWIKQVQLLSSPTPGELTEEVILQSNLSPLDMDLSKLPPLLLQTGEDELLRNDSLRLAEQAQKAGVSVQLERYPKLWHVFHFHTGLLKQADFAIGRIADFLKQQSAAGH